MDFYISTIKNKSQGRKKYLKYRTNIRFFCQKAGIYFVL